LNRGVYVRVRESTFRKVLPELRLCHPYPGPEAALSPIGSAARLNKETPF
jgi:hypothetical protein